MKLFVSSTHFSIGESVFPFSFELSSNFRRRPGFDPWVGKFPWRRKWQPAPVFLPGKSHGQRSLVGYSPWGCRGSDMTVHLQHFPETPPFEVAVYLCYPT
ncbi:unnamed protein product [Rangifer tarandus platyrhynchus]|uniref:Uncharacterized protein n=1 Tax=Rangifer tarandus platyrhynchus TaxID=3082113 RepID=A0ABN8Z9D4_RANTA|nr:unnamed protein product [Rangifer tarandus platyrhynchus]